MSPRKATWEIANGIYFAYEKLCKLSTRRHKAEICEDCSTFLILRGIKDVTRNLFRGYLPPSLMSLSFLPFPLPFHHLEVAPQIQLRDLGIWGALLAPPPAGENDICSHQTRSLVYTNITALCLIECRSKFCVTGIGIFDLFGSYDLDPMTFIHELNP